MLSTSIGVVVARFQVPRLHAGHKRLIRYALACHSDVLIILGVRGELRTSRDPLSYAERECLVLNAFPGTRLAVRPIPDHPLSFAGWSERLDGIIADAFPGRKAVLYGSRDSFLPKYTGIHATHEIAAVPQVSGTAVRASLSFPQTAPARAGAIYAVCNRAPITYAGVSLAILDGEHGRVLLIRKSEHAGPLSFVGGLITKADGSAEAAANRHLREAVNGLEVGALRFLATLVVHEPAFKDVEDCRLDTVFVATCHSGAPTPVQLDQSLSWIERSALRRVLVPWHLPLAELLNTQSRPQ